MNIGKRIRMQRIVNRENGRTVIVPLDHGLSAGPMPGIVDMHDTVSKVADGGANAVVMHKGMTGAGSRDHGRDIGLLIHLSASTGISPHANSKVLVGTVEDALRLGADGVSVHVNLGDEDEGRMLADLGRIASEADAWGMPVLAMIYARGPKVTNEYAPDLIAHCARVGAELGADIVKVAYTGDLHSFADAIAGCRVPVVIAGGPKLDSTESFLRMVQDSLKAGASGLSVGRNIFQHPDPAALCRALSGIVHKDWSLEQALAEVSRIEAESQGMAV